METNYYFDCSNESFYEALDRFVDLLRAPIFSRDYADKEKNAVSNPSFSGLFNLWIRKVNSEYNVGYKSDSWKFEQLMSHLSKKGNPYNKFSVGNLETLSHESIREDLIEFYENK